MPLLLWPVRHVTRANVTREYFFSRHLGGGIDAIFQGAVAGVPDRPGELARLEQGSKSPASQGRQVDGNSTDEARTQHLAPRRAQAAHVGTSLRRCGHDGV